MSKADKMFEELGYVKKDKKYSISYSKEVVYNEIKIDIWKTEKGFSAVEDYEIKIITAPELMCIMEKFKELGWLNE